MAKYDIIGSGATLSDDWGKNSVGTMGFRINGNIVERLASDGNYYSAKPLGEPVKTLYWTKNGDVYALTESGRMERSGNLPPNPNAGYTVNRQEIVSKQEVDMQRIKTERGRKTSSSKTSSDKTPLWLWPFKIIWIIIKWLWKFMWGVIEGVDKFGK